MRLASLAPGLVALQGYRPSQDLFRDCFAGLSVAAVALPVSIAYAELAGLDPVTGLYASILPLLAYALFGTSRQLMVNPDAATCAMIAAAVTPLAGGDPGLYAAMVMVLTLFTGLFCILASLFRLGVLADFLSRPILIGFLNGISLSIVLGQVGKLLGFSVDSGGIIPRLLEILQKLPQTHAPTLLVGLFSFAVLLLSQRLLPRIPAALLVLVLGAIAVWLLDLTSLNVAVLAPVQAGLPPLKLPTAPLNALPSLAGSSAGVALVLFTSGTITCRSFASRGGYRIDVDRELVAYGIANLASALSGGFAVTGADSRTAMAVTSGGRSQVTGLVAAAALASILLWFTGPMQFVPLAALGAVLMLAAYSLLDLASLKRLWTLDRKEFALSLITSLGVVTLGAINGILIAVALAVIRFVKHTARPRVELLGRVKGLQGFHSLQTHPDGKALPGLLLLRFNAPLVFFNADHFLEQSRRAIAEADQKPQWFVVDAIPMDGIDISGVNALQQLNQSLASEGIRLVIAGRRTEFLRGLNAMGLNNTSIEPWLFPTLHQAVRAFRMNPDPPYSKA